MKNIFRTGLIISTALSSIYASTLECPRDEGIKECQNEAEAFCDGKSFNIKASESIYKITCSEKDNTTSKINDETKYREDKIAPSSTTQPEWKIALGIGYNGTGTAESDVRVLNFSNGNTGIATVEFDVESGLNLNGEIRHLRQNGWGFTLGVDLDLTREIKTGSVTAGGNTVTISATEPGEWSAVVLYGNAAYKWDNFYIPFGFNVAAINYEEPGLDANSVRPGAQLGVGYQTDSNFVFELYSRALGFDFSYIDGTLDVNFEEGIMTDMALRFKYIIP